MWSSPFLKRPRPVLQLSHSRPRCRPLSSGHPVPERDMTQSAAGYLFIACLGVAGGLSRKPKYQIRQRG